MDFAQLKISLQAIDEARINYSFGSLMQGCLMESMDRDYGEYLHKSQLKPYSQHIKRQGDIAEWVVNTLNEEAERKIIEPLKNKEEFFISHKNM